MKIRKIEVAIKILFIVSLVFILHHKTNILKPFDDLIFIFHSFVSSESSVCEKLSSIDNTNDDWKIFSFTSDKENVNVAIIPKSCYLNKFLSISPLDRCRLTSNLRKLLTSSDAKFVVFDIDLSPLPKIENGNPVSKYYAYCQRKLNSFLESLLSKGIKLVLLDPESFYGESLPPLVKDWKKSMERKGIVFASAKSPLSMGIALRYKLDNSLVGRLLSLMKIEKDEVEKDKEIFINYGFKLNNIKKIDSDIIFIGAGYGKDFFFTPAGVLPGIFVHALAFLSFYKPKKEEAYVGFLMDLIFATVFYFIFSKLWRSILLERKYYYFDFKYVLLIVFILFFGFVSIFISYLLFESMNILTSPIPILIGLVYDSLSNSLLEECRESLKIESLVDNRYLLFKLGFMFSVVAYALSLMFKH